MAVCWVSDLANNHKALQNLCIAIIRAKRPVKNAKRETNKIWIPHYLGLTSTRIEVSCELIMQTQANSKLTPYVICYLEDSFKIVLWLSPRHTSRSWSGGWTGRRRCCSSAWRRCRRCGGPGPGTSRHSGQRPAHPGQCGHLWRPGGDRGWVKL